eukprot:4152770-Prymnesium_polylepis.1
MSIDDCECAPGRVQLPGGANYSCGCPRGQILRSGICKTCPIGYSAAVGDSECRRCDEGYFAPIEFSNETMAISQSTSFTCTACRDISVGAICPWGSTLREVEMKPNYWRLTAESDAILECREDWVWDNLTGTASPCTGGPPQGCLAGQEGPRCKVCSEPMHYVSDDGLCTECPDGKFPAIVAVIVMFATVFVLYLVHLLRTKPPRSLRRASVHFNTFFSAVQSLGPAKMKSAVTYYQIILSLSVSFDLSPIYADFASVMSYFKFIEFDWSEAVYPTGCLVGGYTTRLVMTALTPLCVIISIPVALIIVGGVYTVIQGTVIPQKDENGRNSWRRPSFSSIEAAFLANASGVGDHMVPAQASSTPNPKGSPVWSSFKRLPSSFKKTPSALTTLPTMRPGSSSQTQEKRQTGEKYSVASYSGPSGVPSRGETGNSSPASGSFNQGSFKERSFSLGQDALSMFEATVSRVPQWKSRALRLLPLVIFVVFVMLPSVSRTIFSVWDCEPYKSGPDSEVKFLRRDLSVICGSTNHNQMSL